MFENIINKIKNLFSNQISIDSKQNQLENTELTKEEIIAQEGYEKYRSGINGKIKQKDISDNMRNLQ